MGYWHNDRNKNHDYKNIKPQSRMKRNCTSTTTRTSEYHFDFVLDPDQFNNNNNM